MNKKLILIIIIATMAMSCKQSAPNSTIIDTVSVNRKLLSQLNTDAVETLVIDSNTFVLDAYLWCNLQPTVSGNEKPMIAINWLVNTDSVKIPDNINLVKQYVVYNDLIWISDYENEVRPNQHKYKLEKISRNGPKWGPRVYVDVISQVYDSKTQKNYYIKHKNVFVERVD